MSRINTVKLYDQEYHQCMSPINTVKLYDQE